MSADWKSAGRLVAACERCRWTMCSDDPGSSPKRTASAARWHAQSAGHPVRVERTQVRYVTPVPVRTS